ncbi:MAG: molybdopterin-dependent oxidoreductase [Minwuia sp.]|nr:molybdopterin-dependent oxidoreductase [Minwuia sp.]
MTDTKRIPAFCAQCRSRCGCTAVVEDGRLTGIEPLPDHPSGAKLCPKGRAAPEQVYHPDRLTHPMRRTTPKGAAKTAWERISWDEALDTIAERLGEIRRDHGAEQVAFGVTTPSGTHVSDGIAWIERFIRAYGSPNTIYGTEICNWHKDIATKFTTGHDIGTPDFARTGCVLLWGHNPATTWLARSVEIQKGLRNGARMIVVDPRPTTFARRADCWLRVRPGTDQVLALGLAHIMVRDGLHDGDFLTRWSNGPLLVRQDTGRFLRESDLSATGSDAILMALDADGGLLRYDCDAGRWLDTSSTAVLNSNGTVEGIAGPIVCQSAFGRWQDVLATHTPDRVAGITGVPPEKLQQAASILGGSSSVAYYSWTGVGQSITATQTDRAISMLYAMTGSLGVPGGNVAGGAGVFNDISGTELIGADQKAKALALDTRPLGPSASGWVTGRDVYRAILGQGPYPVRALFAFGGNPLAAQPDTALARDALAALPFHVHADFFLNPSAEYADIVLPVATSWEREGLRTGFDCGLDGLRRVQLRPAVVAPVGEARSDIEIALTLAERLGLSGQMFDGDVDRGHDHALAPSGLTVADLRARPEGATLPGQVAFRAYAELDGNGVPAGFRTPTRRVEIWSEQFRDHGQDALPVWHEQPGATPAPLTLSCAKTVAYCHSQHRNIASLRKLMPDPTLEIAAAAAASRGIANHDWVEVLTSTGRFVAKARLTRDISPNAVFAQHGWWAPDAADGAGSDAFLPANMNQAVNTAVSDPISGSIPLRATPCDVRRLPDT